jgi:hypothetical protein
MAYPSTRRIVFVHNVSIRRKWIIRQKRPIITVIGSHNKTILFGYNQMMMVNNYSDNNMMDLIAAILLLNILRK